MIIFIIIFIFITLMPFSFSDIFHYFLLYFCPFLLLSCLFLSSFFIRYLFRAMIFLSAWLFYCFLSLLLLLLLVHAINSHVIIYLFIYFIIIHIYWFHYYADITHIISSDAISSFRHYRHFHITGFVLRLLPLSFLPLWFHWPLIISLPPPCFQYFAFFHFRRIFIMPLIFISRFHIFWFSRFIFMKIAFITVYYYLALITTLFYFFDFFVYAMPYIIFTHYAIAFITPYICCSPWHISTWLWCHAMLCRMKVQHDFWFHAFLSTSLRLRHWCHCSHFHISITFIFHLMIAAFVMSFTPFSYFIYYRHSSDAVMLIYYAAAMLITRAPLCAASDYCLVRHYITLLIYDAITPFRYFAPRRWAGAAGHAPFCAPYAWALRYIHVTRHLLFSLRAAYIYYITLSEGFRRFF